MAYLGRESNDVKLPMNGIAGWNELILCMSKFSSNTELIIFGIKNKLICAICAGVKNGPFRGGWQADKAPGEAPIAVIIGTRLLQVLTIHTLFVANKHLARSAGHRLACA